jgi:hypothetical protein
VPQHQPEPLDKLLAYAQGYAEFAMRNIGHVPLAFLAESPALFPAKSSPQTPATNRRLPCWNESNAT